jgi:CRP-like cAMP-binding protein
VPTELERLANWYGYVPVLLELSAFARRERAALQESFPGQHGWAENVPLFCEPTLPLLASGEVEVPEGLNRPRNRLLEALPAEAYERIAPHLERVDLAHGLVLHRPGADIEEVYFPINCLLSITVTVSGGATAEAGAVGRWEMIGVNAFMGGRETTQTEYIVQVAGEAVRSPAQPMRQEFEDHRHTRAVFLKYTQAFIAQLSQNVACNRLHAVEQRLARWLLDVRDRIGSDDLKLTHEFISQMLGIRRASVTEAANRFEAKGLLQQPRGMVRIVDADQLSARACECHRVLLDEYDRLLR